MIEKWIESVFLKRAVLAFTAALIAHTTTNNLPGLSHLSAIGIHLTVQVDPARFNEWLTMLLIGFSQGAHEWAASKWPELGKYL